MHVACTEMKSVLTSALVFHVLLFSTYDARDFQTVTSEITMRTTFMPSVIRKTCLLIPDRGPCRGNIQMYYYDPKENECDVFEWGGCMGNGNRFNTKAECNTSCLSQPNVKLRAPRFCQLAFDYGFCFGEVRRYYYDRFWRVCKEALYSGCGGNRNNFYHLEQCEQICRFGKKRIGYGDDKTGGGIRKVIIINPTTSTKFNPNATTVSMRPIKPKF